MRILLIEDDNQFRVYFSSKLKEQGFEVYTASDGDEGLQQVKKINPELIILDIIMPRTDGFEVLAALSKNQELKKIPVIVFSTLGQEQDITKPKKLLIAKSILDEKEADDLMQLAFHTNVSFVQLLIDKDIISDSNLGLIISDFLHFPFIILSKTFISDEIAHLIPEKFARTYNIIP